MEEVLLVDVRQSCTDTAKMKGRRACGELPCQHGAEHLIQAARVGPHTAVRARNSPQLLRILERQLPVSISKSNMGLTKRKRSLSTYSKM